MSSFNNLKRKCHKYEGLVGFMSVGVTFSVSPLSSSISEVDIRRSLLLTSCEHSVLRHVVLPDEKTDETSETIFSYVSLPKESLFQTENFLRFESSEGPEPDRGTVQHRLAEEGRKPLDKSKGLFTLTAVHHTDATVFYWIVNHGVTDGPSVFSIVESFLDNLSFLLKEAEKNGGDLNEEQFEAILTSRPVLPLRDLIDEVLALPRATSESEAHPHFTSTHGDMLTLPKLTETNSDEKNNGCMRAIFRELDETTTSLVLANCRRHGVGFQSLLSATASLSLIKLLHTSGQLDESWNTPIFQMCPVNMRKFLFKSADDNADNVSAALSGALWWRQEGFKSVENLKQTLFWTDLVSAQTNTPLRECLSTAYPFQWLSRVDSGQSVPPYSLVVSSIGQTNVKQEYNSALKVNDVSFYVGFSAASQEAYDNPVVPAVMITNHMPGHAMLHAYTVLGRLKLTGAYYAYSTDFAAKYSDEVLRILKLLGSETGENADLKIGDVFSLEE